MSKHTPGPWEFVDSALVGPKIDGKPIWLRPVILRSETGVQGANARPWEQDPEPEDHQHAGDFPERCPDTDDMFGDEDAD